MRPENFPDGEFRGGCNQTPSPQWHNWAIRALGRGQEEHRLLPAPAVEWGPGRTVALGSRWECILARHIWATLWRQSTYSEGWRSLVSLVGDWGLHPGPLSAVRSPHHMSKARNQIGNWCIPTDFFLQNESAVSQR